LSNGDEERHRLLAQSPSDERQSLRGGAIEPVAVIDNTKERTLLRDIRQQAESREADEKALGYASACEAECGRERVALRSREAFEPIEYRHAKLMERRIWQLHLGLDAGRSNDPKVGRLVDRVLEQGALSDSGIPVQDKHLTAARPNRGEYLVQRFTFRATAPQHRSAPPPNPNGRSGKRTRLAHDRGPYRGITDATVLRREQGDPVMTDATKRLLVLENDPEIADLLRLILEEAGFAVGVVRDGEPLPVSTEADLVISDLALLRGYDSEEAVRRVRALRSATAGPVLVLTAHQAAASDDELAKEATAVMAKPFDLEALLASVATITGFHADPDPNEGFDKALKETTR
jgi:CheY-like chemotaxis protein